MERIRISAGRRRSWLHLLRPVLGAVVLVGLIATAWAWALHASGERVYTTGEIKAALHGQPHAWAGRVVLVRGLFGGGEYECRPTSPHCAIPLWMTLKSGCDTAGRCTIALWDTITTMRGDQEGEDNTGLMLPRPSSPCWRRYVVCRWWAVSWARPRIPTAFSSWPQRPAIASSGSYSRGRVSPADQRRSVNDVRLLVLQRHFGS